MSQVGIWGTCLGNSRVRQRRERWQSRKPQCWGTLRFGFGGTGELHGASMEKHVWGSCQRHVSINSQFECGLMELAGLPRAPRLFGDKMECFFKDSTSRGSRLSPTEELGPLLSVRPWLAGSLSAFWAYQLTCRELTTSYKWARYLK